MEFFFMAKKIIISKRYQVSHVHFMNSDGTGAET